VRGAPAGVRPLHGRLLPGKLGDGPLVALRPGDRPGDPDGDPLQADAVPGRVPLFHHGAAAVPDALSTRGKRGSTSWSRRAPGSSRSPSLSGSC
jgi:hypothetical protein